MSQGFEGAQEGRSLLEWQAKGGLFIPAPASSRTACRCGHWLCKTRQELHQVWLAGAYEAADVPKACRSLACEIAWAVALDGEHLNIPCAVLSESNEVEKFLSGVKLAHAPDLFLRLYLMMLHEFVDGLRQIGNQSESDQFREKPPAILKTWANHWAKHRVKILIQNHPIYIFQDEIDRRDLTIEEILAKRNRRRLQISIVSTAEICDERLKDIARTNDQTVILVPALSEFLYPTIDYYRRFVDWAKSNPEEMRRYSIGSCSHG